MMQQRYCFALKNLKHAFSVLTLSIIVSGCVSTESTSSCSRLLFQPHGSNAFNNVAPVCPESKIYSYDPMLFERQATWDNTYAANAEESDKDSKKKKSSI